MNEKAQKHSDLIFDVGMHKGEDTDYYLKKGFNVVAFEANPELVKFCKERFAEEIQKGKLKIIEGAIIDGVPDERSGKTVKFFRNKDVSVWGTVDESWAKRNEILGTVSEVIEIPVVDFTECLRLYGVPHYLKIDIEGMDTVCLRALKNVESRPDYVSIESEKVSFEKLSDELDLLRQLGYTSFKAVQQYGISRQKEPNPAKEKKYLNYHFQEGSSGLFGEDLPFEWKNYDQILRQYKAIFKQYRILGDNGLITRYFIGKIIRRLISVILRRPIPGWYDTHAKHSSL